MSKRYISLSNARLYEFADVLAPASKWSFHEAWALRLCHSARTCPPSLLQGLCEGHRGRLGCSFCQILIYSPLPFNHTADAPVQAELSNLHSSHAVPHSPAHNTQLHSVASQTDCEALKNSCCECSVLCGWGSILNAGKFVSWWPGCVSLVPSAVSVAEQGAWVNPEGGTKCIKERASTKLQFYGLWCK